MIEMGSGQPPPVVSSSASLPASRLTRAALRTSETRLGALILGSYIVLALFEDFLVRYSPTRVFTGSVLAPPSSEFWFGTDGYGMDVFSRTIAATRLDLALSASGVVIAFAVGTALGLMIGYYGGALDLVVVRVLDILQAFPALILGLAIVAATQQSLVTVVAVIAFLDFPVFARLVRSETRKLRNLTMTEAAVALGNPTWRVLMRHILPNAVPPLLIQSSLRLAWAVNIVAGLAFVGVGIEVPTPEWGSMIRIGADQIAAGQWWPSAFPGLAILVLTIGLNLTADGLQEQLQHRT
jgi:peptide/nickel transport system permease protein